MAFMRRWFSASLFLLLQVITTMKTLVKKGREPQLHLSCTHRKHPSYATTSRVSQPARCLALDPCHMDDPFPSESSRAVSYISGCFVFLVHPHSIILQGLHVGTGSSRILSANQGKNVQEFKKNLVLPVVAHRRCRIQGLRIGLTGIPVTKKKSTLIL